VQTLVVGQSLRHVAIGVIAGLAGALLLGQLMTRLLHGVTTADPLTLAAATLLLGIVALVASGIPAWRASRIAPVVALREE
jgi:putative ABC transport system permease protein